MNLIKLDNVSFAYSGVNVINNLSFSIDEGDYLCIVGENGAGKSTLIKGLLNLKKASSGNIIKDKSLKEKEIGYLPQASPMQNDFPASVFEIVLAGCLNKIGLRPFYTKKEKKFARKYMKKLNILDLEHSCYRELSGGQQRRVLLARALCSTSKLFILDEPCTGLDPVVTRELYQIIKQVNVEMGISIIMVSHDIKSSLEYANKVLHINDENTFFGTIEDYRQSAVGKRFLGD